MVKNVLSLFDGISGAKIALKKANVKYENYYASEIDKYAIAVSRYNHADIIHIGNVKDIDTKELKNIDLVIGGSPCQNLSVQASIRGNTGFKAIVDVKPLEITKLEQYLYLKKNGAKFVGQSYLFWEYVRIIKELQPKYFILENVKMPKKYIEIINEALGVEPIEINSATLSGQNRKRLYWTNIPIKGLPEDKNILLVDVLEDGEVDKKFYLTGRIIEDFHKKYNIFEFLKKRELYFTKSGKYFVDRKKSYAITARYYNTWSMEEYFFRRRRQIVFEKRNGRIIARKLTPLECERLQTIPDNYTQYGIFNENQIKELSSRQRYKLIGNAFTIDVIAWILQFIGQQKRLCER